jgi:hypothetical protein
MTALDPPPPGTTTGAGATAGSGTTTGEGLTRGEVTRHITSPKAGGGTLDVRGVNVFHVTDGKIRYFANFHDTAPFAADR